MIKTYIRIAYNYLYDLKRFLANSSIQQKKVNNRTQLQALVTMDYHRLEKGLALRNPRVGFGQDVIERLLINLPNYIQLHGWDETAITTLNVLMSYDRFNSANGNENVRLKEKIDSLKQSVPHSLSTFVHGGILATTKAEILEASSIDIQKFFSNRFSVRNYTDEPVDMELIAEAVRLAQKTPSVCNRQSSKVYVFSTAEDKEKVLGLQTGNRGFGEQADKVLIVSSNLEHFTDIGERNQCWIDGGMFAMSLVYALHALGVGTCCLNWSVGVGKDKALKKMTGIPDSDSVIMMISVGHIPETLNIAQSPRKPLEDVLIAM